MIAGAKINLCLRVGPVRDDGYHDVATVIAALALGDDVKLEPAGATLVHAPALAAGDTIVTRALGLLARRTSHPGGWRVHIDKYVPVGAGLGGGSADAAAALALANATLPEPLAQEELIALAAEVGSDVPFFVSGRETALARGRGELLEACPVVAPAWVVVAWPGVSLGTAEVYAHYRPQADAHERVASLAAGPFRERRRRATGGAGRERSRRSGRGALPAHRVVARALPGARRRGRERERLGLGGVRPVRFGRAPRRRLRRGSGALRRGRPSPL